MTADETPKVEILIHRPLIRTVEEYWNFRRMCWIVAPVMQWIVASRLFSDERRAQAQFVLDFIKEIFAEADEDDPDS